MKWFSRRPSSALVAAAGMLVGIGGIAVAAIPDSGGVIHGCYKKTNGHLRVVTSENECRQRETAIQWNQRGPAGPPGPPGPAGSGGAAFGPVVLADGEQRSLLTKGPFSLYAKCDLGQEGSPGSQGFMAISTTVDHAAVGVAGGSNGSQPDITTTTPEDQRHVLSLAVFGQTGPGFTSARLIAVAPDGFTLSGDLYGGIRVLNRGQTCVFGGRDLGIG